VQAIEEFGDIDVYTSSFRPMKVTLSGLPEKTFVKIIVDATTDKVIGIHMCGDGSPEILQVSTFTDCFFIVELTQSLFFTWFFEPACYDLDRYCIEQMGWFVMFLLTGICCCREGRVNKEAIWFNCWYSPNVSRRACHHEDTHPWNQEKIWPISGANLGST